MILASSYVYQIWIKDALTISFSASLFMGIYVIALSWHNSFVYLINGIGKIRLQLYIYIVMGLLVIPIDQQRLGPRPACHASPANLRIFQSV